MTSAFLDWLWRAPLLSSREPAAQSGCGPAATPPRSRCMSDSRPIGVFDSGIGGLTVVKALRDLLPNEKIFYLVIRRAFHMAEKAQARSSVTASR